LAVTGGAGGAVAGAADLWQPQTKRKSTAMRAPRQNPRKLNTGFDFIFG
jgi:hypothetical protein